MILFLLLAFAQAEDRQIKYQHQTEIDFDALDITGEMVKPQGSLIVERQSVKFNPLIELRLDWNEEMKSSVNEIK
jgi:hypothetical protein